MLTAKLLCRSPAYLISKRCFSVCLTRQSQSAPFPVAAGGVKQTSLSLLRRSSPGQTQGSPRCLPTRCLSTNVHPEDGALIYTGSLASAIRGWLLDFQQEALHPQSNEGVKFFSYSTSAASLLIMPQILFKTGLGLQSVAAQVAFCGIIGFFTFLTPVLLHLLTKGYVIRLYHRPDTDMYTAVTYNVFLMEKKSLFHQSQVRVPEISKMFTTFYAQNMGLLVNPDLFVYPQEYSHLMGYDRPFSFSSDDMDPPEKS